MISPMIGFGLDAKYTTRYPNGMEGLCTRYHDRLTHLSIVGIQEQGQAEHFKMKCSAGLPIVHHLSNVAPADPDGPHLDKLKILDEITEELNAIWTCEDIGIWSIGPYNIPYFAPPLFEFDTAEKIAMGINQIQDSISVPFLAEIPSCSFVAGRLDLGEFFHILVDLSKCKVLLDISHVYSYALYCGKKPLDVLESLPLDQVLEIHIAGGRINEKFDYRYIDTHGHPILVPILELMCQAVVRCNQLRCITYEIGIGLSEQLIDSEILRLEETLDKISWLPRLESHG